MSSNEHVVACARSWLGTRFHHQGRIKKTDSHKGGVDCLGLLVGVADELSLTSVSGQKLQDLDETDYSHYPDSAHLRVQLEKNLIAIPIDSIGEGDILLMNIDDHPQHLGIVSELGGHLGLIHAYAPARAVVEHTLDGYWLSRIEASFCIPF